MLERGASLVVGYPDPLEFSSRHGHVAVVKLLLGWKANDTRFSDMRVKEALRAASQYGHLEVARVLVEYGTTVHALSHALYHAVERNQIEIALLLLDSGASFNVAPAAADYSAWMLACRHNLLSMMRLLLDRGADPNALDARGWSPLMTALSRPDVLKILLERGADPNLSFVDGSAALLDVVRYKYRTYLQAITVLLEHGADPNLAHTVSGETALMLSAPELRINVVKLLLEYGADVTQVNREGKSVLDMLGRTRKYGEVVELCTAYIECNKPGAKPLLK